MNLTLFFVHIFLATFTLVNAESIRPTFWTSTLTAHIGSLWSSLAATTTGEVDGTRISSTAFTSHTSATTTAEETGGNSYSPDPNVPVHRCFAGGDDLDLPKALRNDNAIRFCESQRDATLSKDFSGISRTYHLNETFLNQMFQVTWVPKCKAANAGIAGDGACSSILRTLGNCRFGGYADSHCLRYSTWAEQSRDPIIMHW
ncbi:hypothetical protein B0J13DRAFT_568078 [Dactylonectria estremocensis]|uniref:Uncharacterized protein n=1 Tax=Dactylonectria estremocensis TaxID=1079267 RepID=A0A9P9DGB5_9HYPO|nr:hypothetical protein B0J13DRAFT_568078 [Dactylonectria estremocensis]